MGALQMIKEFLELESNGIKVWLSIEGKEMLGNMMDELTEKGHNENETASA